MWSQPIVAMIGGFWDSRRADCTMARADKGVTATRTGVDSAWLTAPLGPDVSVYVSFAKDSKCVVGRK